MTHRFCRLLGFLVLAGAVLPGRADRPPGELTPEDQARLEKEAGALYQKAVQLHGQARFRNAVLLMEQALNRLEQLYPSTRYPDGHPNLAVTLGWMGFLYQDMGEYGKALPYYEKALAMYQKLYPAARYPDGHPDLASSLNLLGLLLQVRGEYGKALPYYEKALAMRQKLFPVTRYPDGHPYLANSLNNLGTLLQGMREYGKALLYYEKALAMQQKLFPVTRYPDGHPDLAANLNNLGTLLQYTGEYGKALPYNEKAVAMYQKLYPAARYPNGHPLLAQSLNNLGTLLHFIGESGKALPFYERALTMRQKLYPAARYPNGHPLLAQSLSNLGGLLQDMGEYGKALPYVEKALAMDQQQLAGFAEQAAEAEALALGRRLPLNRDGFLSLTGHLAGTEAAAYRQVWHTKAALMRVLAHRHLAALAARDTPAAGQHWRELADVRRRLAFLLAAPVRDPASRQREIRELTDRKEKLERDLAAALPRLVSQPKAEALEPEALARHLPPRTAFVDLLRYMRMEQDAQVRGNKGQHWTLHYVAFLLAAGQPVRRIELGPAEAIEKPLRQWRADIAQGKDGTASGQVSRLLWQPIVGLLPRGTQQLYLSPDEDLAGLPWAAFPVGEGEVLLERYTVAVVPHGPFLLDQLRHPAQTPKEPGRLLALGGVQYSGRYPALPGTGLEQESVAALARPRPLVRLDGVGTSASRLLEELPKARYAHLATHGFFNEAVYLEERDRQARLMKTWHFDQNRPTERVGLGARNPLGFTGLVLAGEGKKAILTGEGLVELPLEGLYLAVLSACETGLGPHSVGGEVHGLQRAFHLAGCRNVVVSLWQVPDVSTLVLMEEFYQRLWDKKKPLPPAEALRQAQLEVLRHPEKVIQRARKLRAELVKRGVPKADLRGIQKVLTRLPEGGKVEELKRSSAQWWAGFVLSGDGR